MGHWPRSAIRTGRNGRPRPPPQCQRPPEILDEEPRMTRSAHYAGNRTFTVDDTEPVPPAAGQVRLDIAYTGICGTDLHILHGAMDHRVHVPAVIGHEMSGRIAEIGADVQG